MGRGAPHVAGALGDPLADTPSLPHRGCGSPDGGPGGKHTAGDGGRTRSARAAPSVTRSSQGDDEGPHAGTCPRRPGRFLVGGCGARLDPGSHLISVEAMGQRVPSAMPLLGAPDEPHALCAQKSQDTPSMGDSTRRISYACAHPRATCTALRRWARLGHPAGPSLSPCLLSGRRSQWCARTTPSQSAGPPQAAVQGVDRPA